MVVQGVTSCCLYNFIVNSGGLMATLYIDIAIGVITTYLICDFINWHFIVSFFHGINLSVLFITH